MMTKLLTVRERLSAVALVAAMGCATAAQAQAPTVDGTRDASYPAALAVQTTNTGFGNSSTGQVFNANGSELDNIHAYVVGTDLHIFIGGNLESNFNKLDLFFDSKSGGQNQLTGNSNYSGAMNGLTFDAGFAADYALEVTTGNVNSGASSAEVYANYAILPTGGGSNNSDYINTGGTAAGLVQPLDFAMGGGSGNGVVAINNSNTGGVDGNGGTAATGNPGGVTTGIEYRIPLSALGTTANGGDIKIIAFINSSGRDFVSNQVLAGLPATAGNLGSPAGVNFASQAGNQYVVVSNSVTTQPNIGVSPAMLNFYNLGVGSTSTRQLTIANTGTAALTVASIVSNNLRFTVPTGAFTVPVNGSVNVPVTFAPNAAGAQTGTLTIASNDPADPTVTVSVSGTGIAAGQVVLDGTADSGLYTQKAVQTAPTKFGNNLSELDAAYVRVDGSNLYLTIAGNLESNGNKLVLFFDADPSTTAGQSTIATNNSTAGSSGNLAGLTFDRGFRPESFIAVNQSGSALFADFVRLDNGATASQYLSSSSTEFTQPLNFGNGNIGEASFNNSNTAGVSDTATTGAAAVTTGLELRIPLSALASGITGTTPIHVMALVTNGDYGYLSNQTLGGLPATTGNLGTDGSGNYTLPGTPNAINFQTYAGNQFFTAQRGSVTVANSRDLAGEYANITVASGGQVQMPNPLDVNGALTVQSGGAFVPNCGQALTGSGSFTLAAGGLLQSICDLAGITASSNAGAIRVTGARSFSNDASYQYIGDGSQTAQVTGNGLPTTVRNLVVASSGPALTLSQPVSVRQLLRLVNDVNTNGQGLTLLSDALIDNAGGVVNGTGTMQRAITGSVTGPAYRHFSSPVQATTVADLGTTGFTPVTNQAYNAAAQPNLVTPFPTVFGYDQSRIATVTSTYGAFDKGWFSPLSNSAVMQPNRGYTVNAPATATPIDFVGTFNTGAQNSGTLSRGADAQAGWQLLGNPYPAPLDWGTVTASQRPGMEAGMYVYRPTGQYAGTYRTYANGVGESPIISAGSGYFVRVATANSTGSVNLTNANRVTTYGTVPTFGRGTADQRPQLQLRLQGAGLSDEAYVYLQAGATAGLDAEYDAVKLPNTDGLNLAAVAGTDHLAINGLPLLTAATVVPLHVGVPAAGSYTFEAAALVNFTSRVYLLDAVTGQQIDLHQQPSYAFTTTATTLDGRFSLHFAPAGAPLASNAAVSAAQIGVFPNPARQRFTVLVPAAKAGSVTVTMFNSLGQPVRTVRQAAAGEATSVAVEASGLAVGVYTLRVQTATGTVSKRVVLE